MAVSALHDAFGEEAYPPDLPLDHNVRREDRDLLLRMINRGINCPLTSGCGRRVDAVAAIVGVRFKVSYEAQAAIELEAIVDESISEEYEAAVAACEGSGPLPLAPLVRAIVGDVRRGEPPGRIAARFHARL